MYVLFPQKLQCGLLLPEIMQYAFGQSKMDSVANYLPKINST